MFKKILMLASASHAVLAKHMYMDLVYDDETDMYFANGVYGSQKKEVGMWLTTATDKVGIITQNCASTQCKVNDQIMFTESTSFTRWRNSEDVTTNEYMQYNDRQLLDNSFTGPLYEDDIVFNFNNTESTNSKTVFMAVHNSKNSFKSQFSGFIGIAPYTYETRLTNFIYQLMQSGITDTPLVQFYVSEKKKSSVKFGGLFDYRAILGDKYYNFHTKNKETWALSSDWSINRQPEGSDISTVIIQGKETRDLLIDPQLTYIYLPDDDFRLLEAMDPNIRCSFDSNFCKYLGKCENVNQHQLRLNFNIVGENGFSKGFDIKIEDLFVTGATMKLNNNFCYLKVFRSLKADQNTIYVGNAFLQKYYVAFDMTPHSQEKHDHIQVIIAEKDENWTPNDYEPEEEKPEQKDEDKNTNTTSDASQDKKEEEEKEEGIDTSDTAEGAHDIPDEETDQEGNTMTLMAILGGSALTLIIMIVILGSCCCKKGQSYKYKSVNLQNQRSFTEATDTEALDQNLNNSQ